MFHCTDCNRLFKEPIVEYDDPSPKGISLPPGFYTYTYCPFCKSDWIEEVSNDEED